MMGIGFLGLGLSVLGLLQISGNKILRSESWGRLWLLMIPLPFLGNSFGWLLTEMGRQPWVVNPGVNNIMLITDFGVSGNVSAWTVGLSLARFTALYTGLGVVWILLIRRYALEGINTKKKVIEYDTASDAPMSFVY